MRLSTWARLAAVATAGMIALSACGSSSSPNDSSSTAGPSSAAPSPSVSSVSIEGVGTVEYSSSVAAALPAEFAEAGEITVATNAPYPPFIDFVNEGDQTAFKGLDFDLMQAIGARLGVAAPFTQQPFDGLVPGLQAGKYDAIIGGITDNKERQAAATFVDYSASGTGLMVLAGNPSGIEDLSSLCGTKVAAQKASKQVDLLKAYSDESCAGKAIEVTAYPQNTDALNALLAGQVQAFAATKVNLVDIAKKNDKVEVLDDPAEPNGYAASPNGIGVVKSQAELATAIQGALQSLMDDGTYTKILAKWGQEPIGIPTATINAAID